MLGKTLQSKARVVLVLNVMFNVANSLCSVFVGVYLWINSLDLHVVCGHYLAVYAVTPVVFLLAGWYAQARDRVHVFRIGLALHALYYGMLLLLREQSAAYAVPLGALLGVTWGFFYAGANTFNYDVTEPGERDYFFGWLHAVGGIAQLVGPLLSAFIIRFAPNGQRGYLLVFALAVLLYLASMALSIRIPPDCTRRRYRIWRALFPGRDQRDWQYLMLASVTLAGTFNILHFLLALLMFMSTGSETSVGGFAAFQALAGIVVAYLVGHFITPGTRRKSMLLSVLLLLSAGLLISVRLSVFTLILFGFLRSVSMPLFSIPHSSVRFDVIDRCAEDPSQRIEYLCAWEIPLALGRIVMMTALILLSGSLGEIGLRLTLFLLCAIRIATYVLVTRTTPLRQS